MIFEILMVILLLPVLAVAAIFGLLQLLDVIFYPKAIKEFKDLNLPNSDEAVACFERVRQIDRSVRLYDASAPLVMLIALLFTPRSAEKLPKIFSKWDNDVSINGDGWGQFVDGKWVRADSGAYPDVPWVSYSDPAYTGDAYYAKGHHPRSYWARYIWLGWRNRASKISQEKGIVAKKADIELVSGDIDVGTRKEGYFFLKHGNDYHYKSFKRIGKFVMIRSIGFKLEIRFKMSKEEGIVAAVMIPISFKRWKGN